MKRFIKWLIDVDGMAWATFFIVVAQGFHYYHFFIGIKLFEGIANILYAIFLTIVLSIPLMIFTTKLGTIHRTKKGSIIAYNDRIENYQSAINWYTGIDIVVNIYTWYNKLDVFLNFDARYIPKYIVVTTIAILIPITLKKFAGEIKIK